MVLRRRERAIDDVSLHLYEPASPINVAPPQRQEFT
jgi:hypothetical protein